MLTIVAIKLIKYSISHINIKQKVMSIKKKSDLSTSLDDLRNQDTKKRIAALADLRQIATTIGPNRVRAELITFLAQFIEDEDEVVMELLSQLQNFTSCVGGSDQEKCLIPLLTSFCKTDQKKPAFKATAIMKRILANNKELALDTIKKLIKTEMNIAKECGAQLIVGLFPQLQGFESTLVELYTSLIGNDNLQLKIIAAKYLQDLLRNLKLKEQCAKILQSIYSEGDDLAKIFGLGALLDYYDVSSNSCLTKFKNLSVINSWRINIKICDLVDAVAAKITKAHFKLIFQPMLLKFMGSAEPQLRAAVCRALSAVAKNLNDQQMRNKLIPAVKKLAADPVDFVKVELSKNIVGLCGVVSGDLLNDCLLPIIFTFIKDPNSEISLGVVRSFDYLSTRMSRETLQEKIITPLLVQLSNDSWRNKCQILQILRGFLVNQSYLTENVLKVLFGLTDDRIDAVRLKVNQFIVEIVAKNTKDWCQQNIIPKIYSMKDSVSYIKRQNLLDIIDKTIPYASEKTVRDVYQAVIVSSLADKVSNVRVKAIQLLKIHNKLNGIAVQKQLEKLKEDKDADVKQAIKKLRG